MDHPLVAKVAWASAILAIASLAIGLWSASGRLSARNRTRLGTLIVAFWVLAPPEHLVLVGVGVYPPRSAEGSAEVRRAHA